MKTIINLIIITIITAIIMIDNFFRVNIINTTVAAIIDINLNFRDLAIVIFMIIMAFILIVLAIKVTTHHNTVLLAHSTVTILHCLSKFAMHH